MSGFNFRTHVETLSSSGRIGANSSTRIRENSDGVLNSHKSRCDFPHAHIGVGSQRAKQSQLAGERQVESLPDHGTGPGADGVGSMFLQCRDSVAEFA